jgi:hypothetical protein
MFRRARPAPTSSRYVAGARPAPLGGVVPRRARAVGVGVGFSSRDVPHVPARVPARRPGRIGARRTKPLGGPLASVFGGERAGRAGAGWTAGRGVADPQVAGSSPAGRTTPPRDQIAARLACSTCSRVRPRGNQPWASRHGRGQSGPGHEPGTIWIALGAKSGKNRSVSYRKGARPDLAAARAQEPRPRLTRRAGAAHGPVGAEKSGWRASSMSGVSGAARTISPASSVLPEPRSPRMTTTSATARPAVDPRGAPGRRAAAQRARPGARAPRPDTGRPS